MLNRIPAGRTERRLVTLIKASMTVSYTLLVHRGRRIPRSLRAVVAIIQRDRPSNGLSKNRRRSEENEQREDQENPLHGFSVTWTEPLSAAGSTTVMSLDATMSGVAPSNVHVMVAEPFATGCTS